MRYPMLFSVPMVLLTISSFIFSYLGSTRNNPKYGKAGLHVSVGSINVCTFLMIYFNCDDDVKILAPVILMINTIMIQHLTNKFYLLKNKI